MYICRDGIMRQNTVLQETESQKFMLNGEDVFCVEPHNPDTSGYYHICDIDPNTFSERHWQESCLWLPILEQRLKDVRVMTSGQLLGSDLEADG